jgi:hypothetical protein
MLKMARLKWSRKLNANFHFFGLKQQSRFNPEE